MTPPAPAFDLLSRVHARERVQALVWAKMLALQRSVLRVELESLPPSVRAARRELEACEAAAREVYAEE